jgi:multidrug efflux pump
MSPSRIFILRPIATTLLMVAILLTGIIAYRQLPVSALPEVDYPTIEVMAFYPGASADVTASAITAPLERQFGQVPGLAQMTSTSSVGASVIVLKFLLEMDIDVAEQEVQAAINAAQTYLPADMPTPPTYSKTNPADAPILTLALTSKTTPLSQIEDFADTHLAQKISQLPGVGLVSLSGGQKPAIRIQANPTALSSYNLNLEDLRGAITSSTTIVAKGSFDGATQSYQIDANDQLLKSEDYKSLIVAYKNGAPIRLDSVAQVTDGVENRELAAWTDKIPAIIVNIQRQPGANIINVVDRVKKLLPQLKASLPASVQIATLTDRTTTIRASVEDVEFELILTIALVVMVIFVFLRNLPATIIPSVAVPLSLVGTLGFMYIAGYSLNNLTLMALTIATGFVVDDAIVMIENIMRYIEEGETPLEAALKGSKQIGFTIISLTVSLIAVLIPLLFMGDIVGRLFRQFAVTLAVTILVSAVVSLTLTPMMAARILKKEEKGHGNWFDRAAEAFWDNVLKQYERSLKVVLNHQPLTMLVFALTVALTGLLYVVVPKGFFPVQDTGVIQAITEAPQSTSFAAMAEKQQTMAQAILEDPAVESLSSFIGVDGTNTVLNAGRLQINLKPRDQRDVSAAELIDRLKIKTAQVPGIRIYMQPVQDLTVDDQVTRSEYQITLTDTNQKELAKYTEAFVDNLSHLSALKDVATDQQNLGLTANLNIDRSTASRMGIAASDIDATLDDAFSQRQVSTLYTQINQYHVVLETEPLYQSDPTHLDQIYIRPPANTAAAKAAVPLSAITRLEMGHAPLLIDHLGQFPSVNVSFNLAPGEALGTAISQVEGAMNKTAFPASLQATFQGAAQAFRSSLSNETLLILAALITVYIVLGVLYESFIHPLTILSTLPSAGLGACLALILTGGELNIVSIIGIILLIGIVKKNGIMIIDFALEAERNDNKDPREAIFQASILRFRPIMMTTMAALLAGVPLAFGQGIGSELRHPLGISMVGGLLVSQVLTLYTTPVVYLYFDRFSKWWARK